VQNPKNIYSVGLGCTSLWPKHRCWALGFNIYPRPLVLHKIYVEAQKWDNSWYHNPRQGTTDDSRGTTNGKGPLWTMPIWSYRCSAPSQL